LEGADRPARGEVTSEAAAGVRTAIRRINELVRRMTRRDGRDLERVRG
jgi:hypothetical protein